MRFSRSKQRDRVEALQREVAVAEQDRLAAESALTVARSCLAKSEALVAQHSHRCGVLRDLIKSLADQSNRWWQMSVRATVALQALRMTQQDQAYNASANCALKQATLREQDADNRLANIKKSLGALWTRIQSWSAFSSKAERIRSSTADIGQLELGILSAQKKRDQLNAVLQDAITLATDRARPLEAAKQSDLVNRKEVERLAAMADGIRSSGFSGYLSRASSADRLTLETLQKQAQAEGQARAGRRPPPADDPRRSEKIDRANKERDRRARLKAGHPPLKVEKKEAEDHTNPEHHEKQLYVASMAPFCPKRRFHDERMAKMDPDHQVRYAQFLDWSRQRGWAAAISDALLQDGYFQDRYNNPHAALPLGPGARLIAVRGGHQGFEHLLAARMRSDAQALEFWLGEPVERRVANMGSRSRLKNGAVHLINSWSPELHEPALRGDLDEALARETDLLLARLGLTGHRAATVLHLDSKSGHPHTHIVVSRVSDDGALWSLQGRERAVALWLHGRSNTVTLFGPDALHDDIDALAGPSEAAKAGETLMYHGKLAADRHHLDGRCERVDIQGKEAASRMWHVGRTGADLAGGIWLFGLGADPKAKESWETMMEKVRAKGDKAQEIEVAKLKPAQRGYWLPMHDAKDAPERSTKPGYGHYLARQSKGAKAR